MNLNNMLNKVSVLPDLININCSCSACDSMACYANRQRDHSCTCDVCTRYKRCFAYNNPVDVKTPSMLGSLDEKQLEEEFAREFMDDEEFEFDKYYRNLPERESMVSYNSLKEKLGAIVDDLDISNVRNQIVTGCRKKPSLSTAQLSAQVMNVPFIDFENSISPQKPEPLSNFPKMSFYDLFQKIKEVYKACSCKVCDCIAGKCQKNDFCKCQPCECNVCNSLNFKKEVGIPKPLIRDDYRYSRRSLRGNQKEMKKGCNCLPCECIQCADSMSEPCACEPCQCIQCKPRMLKHQTLVVAAVGDDIQTPRQMCQCSPCECVECITASYGTSSNLVRQDMSTGFNRHPHCRCATCLNEACLPDGNNACRCERRDKVVRKPVERDSNDYDIRTAMIFENKRPAKRRDPITVYTSLTNRYPNFKHPNNNNTRQCDCGPCECLYCSYKESSVNAMRSSNKRHSDNNHDIFDCMNYKRSPDDCCENNKRHVGDVCNCTECDCLNCEKLAEPFRSYCKNKANSKLLSKGKCKYTSCECTDCNKIITSCTKDLCDCSNWKCKSSMGEEIYPIKKGEKLTPTILNNRLIGSFCRLDTEKNEGNILEISARTSPHIPYIANKCFEDNSANKGHYCNFEVNSLNIDHMHFIKNLSKKVKRQNQVLNSLNEKYFLNNIAEKEVTNLQASVSNISTSSSRSNFKDSESDSLQSRNKNKSQASSCNSSGHDNSNYLVKFPKIYTDDIKLTAATNTKLEALNMASIAMKTQLRNSSNFYKHDSSRLNTENIKMTGKLSYDECSLVQNEKFWPIQTSVSNQCNIITDTIVGEVGKVVTTTQTENQNEILVQNHTINHKQFIDYSTRLEEFQKNTNMESVFRKAQKAAYLSKNVFNDNGYYERVQKTLRDARSFSTQLKNMLEKYEKANRDFKSVTQELIYPNFIKVESILNSTDSCSPNSPSVISSSSVTEKYNINGISTDDADINSAYISQSGPHETGEKVANYASLQLQLPLDDINPVEYHIQNKISNKNMICAINNEEEIIKIIQDSLKSSYNCFTPFSGMNTFQNVLYSENELNPILEENEVVSDNGILPTIDMKRKIKISNKRRIMPLNKAKIHEPKTDKSYIKTETNVSYEKVNGSEIKKDLNTDVHPIITSIMKDISAITDDNLATNNNNSSRELKYFEPTTFRELNIIDDNVDEVFTIKPPMQSEFESYDKDALQVKPCLILKKNFVQPDNEAVDRRFSRPLEGETKEMMRSMTMAAGTLRAPEGSVMRYENRALINLQTEVKKLLDIPLPYGYETANQNCCNSEKKVNFGNNEMNSQTEVKQLEIPITQEYETSCPTKHKDVEKKVYFGNSEPNSGNAMKVNFLTVRKVSTHTVMVRWIAPRTLKNVRGYELLVDGQPVQKMLNTSRCMAVVTCLPHCERIILTVRTVTLLPCVDGHCPAVSVVYKPGLKMY